MPDGRSSGDQPARRPQVTGVILAAGLGSRLGRIKPLLDLDGEPLLRRITREALASSLDDVVIVVGHEAAAVAAAIADVDVRVVPNEAYEEGQATSVRAGLTAMVASADGAMFIACDQPDLRREHLNRLLAAFRENPDRIVVPAAGGRRGSPVTFPSRFFADLARLTGDTGGRGIMAAHPDDTVVVELESEAPLHDLDTPDDLTRWHARLNPGPEPPVSR